MRGRPTTAEERTIVRGIDSRHDRPSIRNQPRRTPSASIPGHPSFRPANGRRGWKRGAVFWDAGGVILDLDSVVRGRRLFVADLAERYDLDTDRALEAWREELSAYFAEREGTEYEPARHGYDRVVEAAVGRPVPEEEWWPMLDDASRRALEPVAGTPEAIDRLAGTGLVLAVVSDIDTREAERILDRFGVRDRFDALVTSEDIGRRKPRPATSGTALDEPDPATFWTARGFGRRDRSYPRRSRSRSRSISRLSQLVHDPGSTAYHSQGRPRYSKSMNSGRSGRSKYFRHQRSSTCARTSGSASTLAVPWQTTARSSK